MNKDFDNGAFRKNTDKLRWRNMPLWLLRPIIEVGHAGEKKYGTYNFLKGFTVNTCLDCIKRHLDAFEDPYQSDDDPEMSENLGKPVSHLAAISWNALVALFCLKFIPNSDDRWKPDEEDESCN